MNSSLKIIKIISKKKISKPKLLIWLSSLNKYIDLSFTLSTNLHCDYTIGEELLYIMPFQRSIIERCPRRYEESITLCTHHPSMGGYIYVCSSSSTMYQQHSNVKILEWQQQQQQCFLCNEKQLLNGTELWI